MSILLSRITADDDGASAAFRSGQSDGLLTQIAKSVENRSFAKYLLRVLSETTKYNRL